jgi:hypothetical protein
MSLIKRSETVNELSFALPRQRSRCTKVTALVTAFSHNMLLNFRPLSSLSASGCRQNGRQITFRFLATRAQCFLFVASRFASWSHIHKYHCSSALLLETLRNRVDRLPRQSPRSADVDFLGTKRDYPFSFFSQAEVCPFNFDLHRSF